MKHLFTSGETMYQKNQKELPEGLLKGSFLEYDKIDLNTEFYCIGQLDNRNAKVSFTLSESGFDSIKIKHACGILMQSDILLADWKDYKILDLE